MGDNFGRFVDWSIIASISVIPDAVSRSIYIKTTAQIFEMDEQLLINEVQKKTRTKSSSKDSQVATNFNTPTITGKAFEKGIKHSLKIQEKDLIRLMLNYGALSIPLEIQKENGETVEEEYPLAQFIIEEILTDNLSYSNQKYQEIFNEFIDGLENGLLVNDQHFIQNPDLTRPKNEYGKVIKPDKQCDHNRKHWRLCKLCIESISPRRVYDTVLKHVLYIERNL